MPGVDGCTQNSETSQSNLEFSWHCVPGGAEGMLMDVNRNTDQYLVFRFGQVWTGLVKSWILCWGVSVCVPFGKILPLSCHQGKSWGHRQKQKPNRGYNPLCPTKNGSRNFPSLPKWVILREVRGNLLGGDTYDTLFKCLQILL